MEITVLKIEQQQKKEMKNVVINSQWEYSNKCKSLFNVVAFKQNRSDRMISNMIWSKVAFNRFKCFKWFFYNFENFVFILLILILFILVCSLNLFIWSTLAEITINLDHFSFIFMNLSILILFFLLFLWFLLIALCVNWICIQI